MGDVAIRRIEAASTRPGRAVNDARRNGRTYLTRNEVDQMRKVCRQSGNRHSVRDDALLLAMFIHGLRAAEAGMLRWDTDVDLENHTLKVHRVKGSVDGLHPLESLETKTLRKLRRAYKGSPWVFPSQKGGAIAPRTIADLVKWAGEQIGLAFPAHAHQLRHGCGFDMINRGIDSRLIQVWLGHRAYRSTVRYISVDYRSFLGLWSHL